MDHALTLADENAKAGADPAFDAHIMPIGDWATAVWEAWMPERAMESSQPITSSGTARALALTSSAWGSTALHGHLLADSPTTAQGI